MSSGSTTTTRFFGIPGCMGTVYWHQECVDSIPELKWTAASDIRLRDNSPFLYLEDYPHLQREISEARPVTKI